MIIEEVGEDALKWGVAGLLTAGEGKEARERRRRRRRRQVSRAS